MEAENYEKKNGSTCNMWIIDGHFIDRMWT